MCSYPAVSKRNLYLDLLRIIAITFVIFNHTGTKGFLLYTTIAPSFTYWLSLIFSILCKIAVPIFYMISGALLLPKTEKLAVLYKRRILKYIVVIFIFSFFWEMKFLNYNILEFSISEFLIKIYSSNAIVPYWFLYSYLAALIMLPFIRKLAQNMSITDLIYLILLYFIFTGVIPAFQLLVLGSSIKINLYLPLVTSASIFYFIVGYFIEHRKEEFHFNNKHYIIIFIANILSLCISCLLTFYQTIKLGIQGDAYHDFHSGTVVILTISVFLLFKTITQKYVMPEVIQKVIISFSKTTFGIYLLEEYMRIKLQFIYDLIAPYVHPLISCFFFVACVMMAAWFIVWLLMRIPVVKRLL